MSAMQPAKLPECPAGFWPPASLQPVTPTSDESLLASSVKEVTPKERAGAANAKRTASNRDDLPQPFGPAAAEKAAGGGCGGRACWKLHKCKRLVLIAPTLILAAYLLAPTHNGTEAGAQWHLNPFAAHALERLKSHA